MNRVRERQQQQPLGTQQPQTSSTQPRIGTANRLAGGARGSVAPIAPTTNAATRIPAIAFNARRLQPNATTNPAPQQNIPTGINRTETINKQSNPIARPSLANPARVTAAARPSIAGNTTQTQSNLTGQQQQQQQQQPTTTLSNSEVLQRSNFIIRQTNVNTNSIRSTNNQQTSTTSNNNNNNNNIKRKTLITGARPTVTVANAPSNPPIARQSEVDGPAAQNQRSPQIRPPSGRIFRPAAQANAQSSIPESQPPTSSSIAPPPTLPTQSLQQQQQSTRALVNNPTTIIPTSPQVTTQVGARNRVETGVTQPLSTAATNPFNRPSQISRQISNQSEDPDSILYQVNQALGTSTRPSQPQPLPQQPQQQQQQQQSDQQSSTNRRPIQQIPQQRSSIEHIQQRLDQLNREQEQRQAEILSRQALEDRMAQASRAVRNQIRQDYSERYGRPMSSGSSSSETQRRNVEIRSQGSEEDDSDNERPAVPQSIQQMRRARYARREIANQYQERRDPDDSSSEERKSNDQPNRGIGANTNNNNNIPPIRNTSLPSNVHRIQFGQNRNRNNENNNSDDENDENPSLIQRLQRMSNRNANSPPLPLRMQRLLQAREREIEQQADERSADIEQLRRLRQQQQQSNVPSDARRSASSNPNPFSGMVESNQDGEGNRRFRIRVPLMQFANLNGNQGNPANMVQALQQFVQMMNSQLGNFNGMIQNSNIEDLAQLVATIRLLQGANASRGLKEDQIKEFPLVKLKSVDDDEVCSICLESWNIDDSAKILGCMHRFHAPCIDSWLKDKTICPNCKQDQRDFFTDKIPEHLLEK